MLNKSICKLNENLFENGRFYFWIILVLTFHLFIRHSLIKILKVNGEYEWITSKVFTGTLYALIYVCCIVSAIYLKKKISSLYLYTWISICFFSITNEVLFFLSSEHYDFLFSVFKGQGLTNIQVSLPILFLGIWKLLNQENNYSFVFLDFLERLLLLNCVLISFGIIFDLEIFKSYPGSTRWGYSGLLQREYSVIFSSIFLIKILKEKVKYNLKHVLLVIALIGSGTKAGLFSLGLIFLILVIRSKKTQLAIVSVAFAALCTYTFWVPWILMISPFWRLVYDNHGPWGVLFSLRNKKIIFFFEEIIPNYNWYNWLVGGKLRSEDFIAEMLLFDLFIWYGVVGVLIFCFFFFKIVSSIKEAIPILVGIFSGGFIPGCFGVIVYGIWVVSEKTKVKSISSR